ncbi:hypothetical protein KUW00_06530 [Halomonas sp. DP5N14-9]|uniref:hypothetical protein n=1 Tax=Halomonas sp. DP5N14-9 TaxID=2859075 RepID=UPI001C997028|nr:hypothetical protein [Halomonas sp. DP5N14-9]MBY5940538.1 hypothetical protein [Halomonas sp. DP5N14-9]
MKHSGEMAKDGFGWPFWGGMSSILWSSSLVYWFMFLGPGSSLNKVAGGFFLLVSAALVFIGFVKFTRIQSIAFHKVVAITTLALLVVGMISVMLFSDAWSLEKALGIS